MFSVSYFCICFWCYFMLLSSASWASCVHPIYALFWLGAFAAALDTPVVYKQYRLLFFQQSHCTFLPFINLLLITSGFKIAYSHESAIFCMVWQHTNLLFIQLLDYTTMGQIPSLCVIFLRTGNASETFLGFYVGFQSALGIHPDAETRGSHHPV